MKLDRQQTRAIEEVKYLATENTWRYRTIIREMYRQYDKMKYWLFKEEIYALLKAYEDFEAYTIEQLKTDLEQLTSWGNITALADTTKVKTVEEFKNREFRYQLSPYTIEIERMLIGLLNMRIENTATLEPALAEKFQVLLVQHEKMHYAEDRKTYEWWRSLNSAFKELNQNYQDYIGRFYSPKTEEMMKTTEFLIFKEAFVSYLRDFIKELQMTTLSIRTSFEAFNQEAVSLLLHKALSYEKTIVNAELKIRDEEYMDVNLGRFKSMQEWFLASEGRASLVDKLIESTNEIIRKITRFAAQIAEKRNNNVNRKEEYRKIGQLFSETQSIEEAHKLSALVFGVPGTMHVYLDEIRETESISSSIFDEPPTFVITKPRIRAYREKIIKNPIKDKTALKEQKKQEILQKRIEEEKSIARFVSKGQIDFKALPELSQKDRTLLLRWLTKGRNSKEAWCKTEGGALYKVQEANNDEKIQVVCEDGIFTMPHYIIEFEGKEA